MQKAWRCHAGNEGGVMLKSCGCYGGGMVVAWKDLDGCHVTATGIEVLIHYF